LLRAETIDRISLLWDVFEQQPPIIKQARTKSKYLLRGRTPMISDPDSPMPLDVTKMERLPGLLGSKWILRLLRRPATIGGGGDEETNRRT
jgi:hypothetical protein